MKTFTEAEWVGLHPDHKSYFDGVPLVYSFVKGIGTVWVPVWFSDLPGPSQPMRDAKLARVEAKHGTVELWLKAFTGVEGNEKNVLHLGYQVREFGHVAFSGPGDRDPATETGSVIFPPSGTGLKDAIDRMKRDIERRGGTRYEVKHIKKEQEIDESLARELALYIENDADLYRQQYQPQVLNLARKRYKGAYDAEKAVKLVVYLVESGIKKYRKEFGLTAAVNRATKESAARQILEGMQDEINMKVRELAEKTRKPKAKKKPEKPGSSTFAITPGTQTTTSDGRKVRVIYTGPWSWRAKSESRFVVLFWPDKDEYSTHEQSMADMSYFSGHYFRNFSSALEDFEERTSIRPPEEVFRTKGLPG